MFKFDCMFADRPGGVAFTWIGYAPALKMRQKESDFHHSAVVMFFFSSKTGTKSHDYMYPHADLVLSSSGDLWT